MTSVLAMVLAAGGAITYFQPAAQTTGPLSLYVSSTGSDANSCLTVGSPCLTIQAALARVPKRIFHPVTVTVGAGTFAGFNINGFTIHPAANESLGSYLDVRGTLINATLGSGTSTGTISSTVGGSITAWGTITDSGQAWTPNALRGMHVVITGGARSGDKYVVADNSGTQITVAANVGSSGALPGSTYAIQVPGTVINSAPVPRVARGVQTSATTTSAIDMTSAVAVFDNSVTQSNTNFVLRMMRLTASSGGGTLLNVTDTHGGQYTFRDLDFVTSGGFYGYSVAFDSTATGTMNLRTSYALVGDSSAGFLTDFASGHNSIVKAVVVAGGPYGIKSTFPQGFNSTANYLVGQSSGSVVVNGPGAFTDTGSRITCSSTASGNVGIRSSGLGYPIAISADSTDISGCNVAVQLVAGDRFTTTTAVTGTGNTTAIKVMSGAVFQSTSATSITGGTEISLDGSAYTFAQLRAASPKLLTNTYGSKVFE